ncbi:MAG: spore coat associated protein CotJA [Clostridia bacterium]|nr:spore coat associated protein CotJA [Clostridia bacterium]
MCENTVSDGDCADKALAMAYVPVQQWGNLYAVEEGFDRGTVFSDLDKPFLGGGTRCAL